MNALEVHVLDRRRGRVRLADERILSVVANGDHHGHPCSTTVASYMVALDVNGRAYAVNVVGMTARPLGAVVSSIFGSKKVVG